MSKREIRRMKQKVFEVVSRGLSSFIGEPKAFSAAEKVLSEHMTKGLEKLPKLLPFHFHVIPVDGLPQNYVAVIRTKDDGSFDFEVKGDLTEGRVTVSLLLDVVEIVVPKDHSTTNQKE